MNTSRGELTWDGNGLALQTSDRQASKCLRHDCDHKYESVSCSVMSDSFATPWTVIHQAPLSMEFSRQEYWSGLPFPSPRWKDINFIFHALQIKFILINVLYTYAFNHLLKIFYGVGKNQSYIYKKSKKFWDVC